MKEYVVTFWDPETQHELSFLEDAPRDKEAISQARGQLEALPLVLDTSVFVLKQLHRTK